MKSDQFVVKFSFLITQNLGNYDSMKRATSTENFWTNEKLSLVTMGKGGRSNGGQASQQKKLNLEKNLEELLNGILDNDKSKFLVY